MRTTRHFFGWSAAALCTLALTAAGWNLLAQQVEVKEKQTGKEVKQAPLKLDFKFSGPFTHENLTIFLLHGDDKMKGKNFLTLPEAMSQEQLVIYETKNVNKLEMENISTTHEIILLSGDIISGGQQDRVIVFDVVVPPKSGKTALNVHCVEQTAARWNKPYEGKDKSFHASLDVLNSNRLRIYNANMNQDKIWKEVEKSQHQLGQSLKKSVIAKESESSLQLSLKNKDLQDTTEKYTAKLADIIKDKKDVIGYAFAINGKVIGADVYGSNALFQKVWARLLRANAIEAVMERPNAKKEAKPADLVAIKAFLADAETGKLSAQNVNEEFTRIQSESKSNYHFQTIDQKGKFLIRGAYYAH